MEQSIAHLQLRMPGDTSFFSQVKYFTEKTPGGVTRALQYYSYDFKEEISVGSLIWILECIH